MHSLPVLFRTNLTLSRPQPSATTCQPHCYGPHCAFVSVSMKRFKKVFRRKPRTAQNRDYDAAPDASHPTAPTNNAGDFIEEELEPPNILRALSELKKATLMFQGHYTGFGKKNPLYLQVDDDVCEAIEKAGRENNIKRSAELFGKEISSTIQVTDKKNDLSRAKWHGKLAIFMSKVYPVARLSLRLTSTAAEVLSLSSVLNVRE